MLWFKAFHLIFMVCWFAGLFYLPRLFVYHAEPGIDAASDARFKIMERRLYRGIMTPSMVLTLVCGLGMLHSVGMAAYQHQGWLHVKLSLVALLVVYHYFCGAYRLAFMNNTNKRSPLFFRIFNELPVLILISTVCLAVVKPF